MLCCSIMQNAATVLMFIVYYVFVMPLSTKLNRNINTSLLNVITFSVKRPGMVFQCDGSTSFLLSTLPFHQVTLQWQAAPLQSSRLFTRLTSEQKQACYK